MHSNAAVISGSFRRFVLFVALSSCIAGGVYLPILWMRVVMWVLAACIGMAILVQMFTSLLYVLVDRQRWKYRLWDKSGKTLWVPNPAIQGEDVKLIFGHRDITGKASSGMRQLIRWWHAPCSECHQELMERNDLYRQVRPVTTHILSLPIEDARRLALKHADEAIRRQNGLDAAWSIARLRTLVSPIAVSICYECVFKRECPPEIVSLLGASAADTLAAIGSMKGRNMPLREKAMAHMKSVLEEEGGRPDIFGEKCELTMEQRAKYVLGVWIHTGTAQIARLVSNTLCHLARNRRCMEIVKREMGQGVSYMDTVILESMRLSPGIPSTNRVATTDVAIGESLTFQSGTNFVFDLERYHRTGFDRPNEFIPERWQNVNKKDMNYMPFGVGKQRCPAERFTLAVARDIILRILSSLDIVAPIGFGLLFSTKPQIANDVCCIVRRPSPGVLELIGIRFRLSAILLIENIQKSFTQLMVMPKNAKAAFDEDGFNTSRGHS